MSENTLDKLNGNDERAFEFDDELENTDADLYEDLVEAEAEKELGEADLQAEEEVGAEEEALPESEVESEEQTAKDEESPDEEKVQEESEAPLEVPNVEIPRGPTREEVLPELEKVFQITDPELIESLRMEPEVAIPKVLAGVVYDLHTSLMAQVQQTMPALLYQSYQKATIGRQAEQEFYDMWPDLQAHKAEVELQGARYIRANPGMTRQQAMAEIGAMVMLQKKIPFDPATGKRIEAAGDPKRTAAPRPSGVGAASTLSKSKPQPSFYEQLAEEDEPED